MANKILWKCSGSGRLRLQLKFRSRWPLTTDKQLYIAVQTSNVHRSYRDYNINSVLLVRETTLSWHILSNKTVSYTATALNDNAKSRCKIVWNAEVNIFTINKKLSFLEASSLATVRINLQTYQYCSIAIAFIRRYYKRCACAVPAGARRDHVAVVSLTRAATRRAPSRSRTWPNEPSLALAST